MARKTVAPVPEAKLPTYTCGTCYFFETTDADSGDCFGIPATPLMNKAFEVAHVRSSHDANDRGCIHWKARHTA